jgi:hypothetical protein
MQLIRETPNRRIRAWKTEAKRYLRMHLSTNA